jgi:hypothetical protein
MLSRFIQECGKPDIVRSDNAKEYTNGAFENLCKQLGIEQEFSAPYTPQQNGVVERSWRTLMNMVRCMIRTSKLKKGLWPFAVKHVQDILNCMPRAKISSELGKDVSISHMELWNQEHKLGNCKKSRIILDENHILNWGEKCAVLKQGARKMDKMDDMGEICYYLGEDWLSGSKYFATKDGMKVLSRRNYKVIIKNVDTKGGPTTKSIINVGSHNSSSEEEAKTELDEQNGEIQGQHNPSGSSTESSDEDILSSVEDISDVETEEEKEEKVMDKGKYCNIDKRNIIKSRFRHLAMAYTNEQPDPKGYKEAIQGKEREDWIKAIVQELKTLIDMNVFKKVKREKWMSPLKLKHVFKKKKDENGKPIRYKDRCIVQGFKQIKGIDYLKTKSNVIRKETFRFLCTLAVNKQATIYQADVKNAYPLSKLEEKIYVEKPAGVEFLDGAYKELMTLKDDEILQLLRSLYGLKQAGRNWERLLRKLLKKRGFKPCRSDPCLYINRRNIRRGKGLMAIGTYVDDLPVVSTSESEYLRLIEDLKREIPIISMGKAKWFLSIDITQEQGKIQLSQKLAIEELLKDIEQEIPMKSRTTPMEEKIYNVPLNQNSGKVLSDEQQNKYRALIGSVLYISEWTRPDIHFAVNYLSRSLGKATTRDWKYLLRVIKFLYDTRKQVLEFNKSDCKKPLEIYTDSDWGNDQVDRKSTSGYMMYVMGNLCSWRSKKQSTTALSTTNAEYIAMSEGAREGLFFRNLFWECTNEWQPIYMYCDNRGAVKNAENELQHKRSKHIELKYHHIKDETEKGNIKLTWIPTKNNVADIMTKPVKVSVFKHLTEIIFKTSEQQGK